MEAYIIIISAAITAIAIAYKIVNNLKDNANSLKVFPMVARDGNYVLSFPVVGNDSSIDPVDAVKVYLNVFGVNVDDIESFLIISESDIVDWGMILQSIIKQEDLGELDYSSLTDIRLSDMVVIKCHVELPTPIIADIEFDTNYKINVIRHDTV